MNANRTIFQQQQKYILTQTMFQQQLTTSLRRAGTLQQIKQKQQQQRLVKEQQQQQPQLQKQTQRFLSSFSNLNKRNFKSFNQNKNLYFANATTITTTNITTANLSTSAILKLNKFTGVAPHDFSHISLNEERAHNIIFNINDSERQAIKSALEKYEALKLKEGFEGKLAATQWRTRFGRRSTVPSLGNVDPTGTFCEVPSDWLKKKSVESAKAPSRTDLSKIFFVNAVPFVGFGFLDNFIMIAAGDYIDHAFGTFMCISTMAAAALGNTISDVLGIGSAFYVERGCELLGLRPPDLTPHQLELNSVRRSANMGRIIGITVGCLLGMIPLLFMNNKPAESEQENETDGTGTEKSTTAAPVVEKK